MWWICVPPCADRWGQGLVNVAFQRPFLLQGTPLIADNHRWPTKFSLPSHLQAEQKVAQHGWTNVTVVEGDACTFVPPGDVATLVTFSYSLSSTCRGGKWGESAALFRHRDMIFPCSAERIVENADDLSQLCPYPPELAPHWDLVRTHRFLASAP